MFKTNQGEKTQNLSKMALYANTVCNLQYNYMQYVQVYSVQFKLDIHLSCVLYLHNQNAILMVYSLEFSFKGPLWMFSCALLWISNFDFWAFRCLEVFSCCLLLVGWHVCNSLNAISSDGFCRAEAACEQTAQKSFGERSQKVILCSLELL